MKFYLGFVYLRPTILASSLLAGHSGSEHYREEQRLINDLLDTRREAAILSDAALNTIATMIEHQMRIWWKKTSYSEEIERIVNNIEISIISYLTSAGLSFTKLPNATASFTIDCTTTEALDPLILNIKNNFTTDLLLFVEPLTSTSTPTYRI